MKPFHSTSERIQRPGSPYGITCVLAVFSILGALMPLTAQVQSANSPQPQTAATMPLAPATSDMVLQTPSRRVSPEDFPKYVNAIATVLSIRGRDTDPFGRIQDPDAKPVIKPTIAATKRIAPIQATPFSDIVSLIRVTTIMPGERRFLIGTRSVKQGDRIPLAFRGKNITVEVASVSSNRIQFRKTDTGETAELSLNLMPSGMKPGNDGIHAPGMVPDNPNAPIDLEENSLPLNAAQITR